MVKTAQASEKPRMAFVDNIRWTVIAMVVLMHACVTYSGLGSWYYKEETTLDAVSMLVFAFYQIFAQAFFMGILFFIAAAFTPGAYDRKGFGRFVLDRFLRLGVPTLFYMLVIDPLDNIIRRAGTGEGLAIGSLLREYGGHVASGRFVGASGPLWFALALLAFSIVYALFRAVSDSVRGSRRPGIGAVVPGPRAINAGAGALIAAIGVVSFLVRMVQPLGTSWYNMQLGYFTQYVVLFCVGLWAARVGLLQSLPRRTGKIWMRLAFAVGVPVWLLLMGFGGATSGNLEAYMGGLHWQAALLAVWEAFICVAFSIGMITLYRERANRGTPVAGLLSRTSFGIYVLHAPILIGVSVLVRSVTIYPLAKALAVAVAAWMVSLAVAVIVRRIPVLGKIFA
jgi:peptidoglycan/LPS O-acetylase OafA/YrhL